MPPAPTQPDPTLLERAGWTDLLRLTNAELAARGIPWRKSSALREHVTGHRRSVKSPWWMSVGLWGRIYTADEIAYVLDVSADLVRGYARGSGLRVARESDRIAQADLAALLYLHADEPGTAKHYGVMQVEVKRYALAVEAVLGVPDFEFGQMRLSAWAIGWALQNLHPIPFGLPADVALRHLEVRRRIEEPVVAEARMIESRHALEEERRRPSDDRRNARWSV